MIKVTVVERAPEYKREGRNGSKFDSFLETIKNTISEDKVLKVEGETKELRGLESYVRKEFIGRISCHFPRPFNVMYIMKRK